MRVVISTGRSIKVAEGDNDVDDAASLFRRLFLFEVDEAPPLFFRLVVLDRGMAMQKTMKKVLKFNWKMLVASIIGKRMSLIDRMAVDGAAASCKRKPRPRRQPTTRSNATPVQRSNSQTAGAE